MNHQYGYIQASSSQEVPESHRCPGWPCRAAFCPRKGDWEFDSQVGGGAENRLLFLPEHRRHSGDACLKTHVLLRKSVSKSREKSSAGSAEQVSASRGLFPTFMTRDGNAAKTPQQIHPDRYQIHPQAKDYWLFPAGVPAIRVKNGAIGFTSSEQTLILRGYTTVIIQQPQMMTNLSVSQGSLG